MTVVSAVVKEVAAPLQLAPVVYPVGEHFLSIRNCLNLVPVAAVKYSLVVHFEIGSEIVSLTVVPLSLVVSHASWALIMSAYVGIARQVSSIPASVVYQYTTIPFCISDFFRVVLLSFFIAVIQLDSTSHLSSAADEVEYPHC